MRGRWHSAGGRRAGLFAGDAASAWGPVGLPGGQTKGPGGLTWKPGEQAWGSVGLTREPGGQAGGVQQTGGPVHPLPRGSTDTGL